MYMILSLSSDTPEEGIVSDPITDGCELPCGCWELTSGPLEEQAVLLTTEPFLQALILFLFMFMSVSIYHVCEGDYGSQKRTADSLELELLEWLCATAYRC